MPAAMAAERKSLSDTRLYPPGLNALINTWSFLNVVGLSSTWMPFDSTHSVASTSLCCFSETILPGAGVFAIKGASDTPSE